MALCNDDLLHGFRCLVRFHLEHKRLQTVDELLCSDCVVPLSHQKIRTNMMNPGCPRNDQSQSQRVQLGSRRIAKTR